MVCKAPVGWIVLLNEHYFLFCPSLYLAFHINLAWYTIPLHGAQRGLLVPGRAPLLGLPLDSWTHLDWGQLPLPWQHWCLFPAALWIASCQHLENQVSRDELQWILHMNWKVTSRGAVFLTIYSWRSALACTDATLGRRGLSLVSRLFSLMWKPHWPGVVLRLSLLWH